jgi:uncharacterized protein (DUF1778 family)
MHHDNEKEWIDYGLKNNVIVLSEVDFNFVVDIVNNPPEPSETLKRLFRKYNK